MSDRDVKQQFNKQTRYTCSTYCAHAHNAKSALCAADNGVSTKNVRKVKRTSRNKRERRRHVINNTCMYLMPQGQLTFF